MSNEVMVVSNETNISTNKNEQVSKVMLNGVMEVNDETITNSQLSQASSILSFSPTLAENIGLSDAKTLNEEEKRLRNIHLKEERARLRKMREEELTNERREKAIKAMNYLLRTSQKYSTFFLDKLKRNENKDVNANKRKRKPISEKPSNPKKREVELSKEEIDVLKQKQAENTEVIEDLDTCNEMQQPQLFSGGTLLPYQLEGLLWLKVLFENGINGILADEMGLGKTIQIIALFCYLLEQNIPGPFLIVAPLSTLPNWFSEFKRFAPKLSVVLFHGNENVRKLKHSEIRKKKNVIVVTSNEVAMNEIWFLRQFKWQYLVIDEGHRIKNYQCKLVTDLKKLTTLNRLLLTGTPLQNNLVELWSLLNFLLPNIFKNADTFASLFEVEDFAKTSKILEQEQNTNIISTIHGVLSPFMLRRLKVDVLKDIVPKKEVLVYCPMSQLQLDLYRFVIQENVDKLLGIEEEKPDLNSSSRPKRRCATKIINYKSMDISDDDFEEDSPNIFNYNDSLAVIKKQNKEFASQVNMVSPTIMLKRVQNHPYLVQFPLKQGGETRELLIDEQLIKQSGKMNVLDAMLTRLKEKGHKVLLFSTWTMILDLIEDYLQMRSYEYCRLDGQSNLQIRENQIKSFNTEPDKFVFLISTRAGSLGINLTAADTVIFYDRDWNPQIDIQAQDRCHRIGQTKPVVVYTLISKGTLDERIISRSTAKRKLEKVVITKGGKFSGGEKLESISDLKELEELLNSVDNNQVIQSNGFVFTDEELDILLDRSELYAEMERRKEAKPLETEEEME